MYWGGRVCVCEKENGNGIKYEDTHLKKFITSSLRFFHLVDFLWSNMFFLMLQKKTHRIAYSREKQSHAIILFVKV